MSSSVPDVLDQSRFLAQISSRVVKTLDSVGLHPAKGSIKEAHTQRIVLQWDFMNNMAHP